MMNAVDPSFYSLLKARVFKSKIVQLMQNKIYLGNPHKKDN